MFPSIPTGHKALLTPAAMRLDPQPRPAQTGAQETGRKQIMDASRRSLVIAGAVLAGAPLAALGPAQADVKTQLIDYNADIPLEGYLAYDETTTAKRPGILVAHTRRGIQHFVREQA